MLISDISLQYQGIPTTVDVAVPAAPDTNDAATTGSAPLSGLPNSSPLDMFPQVK